jgi:hypothetical protein
LNPFADTTSSQIEDSCSSCGGIGWHMGGPCASCCRAVGSQWGGSSRPA